MQLIEINSKLNGINTFRITSCMQTSSSDHLWAVTQPTMSLTVACHVYKIEYSCDVPKHYKSIIVRTSHLYKWAYVERWHWRGINLSGGRPGRWKERKVEVSENSEGMYMYKLLRKREHIDETNIEVSVLALRNQLNVD